MKNLLTFEQFKINEAKATEYTERVNEELDDEAFVAKWGGFAFDELETDQIGKEHTPSAIKDNSEIKAELDKICAEYADQYETEAEFLDWKRAHERDVLAKAERYYELTGKIDTQILKAMVDAERDY
jgi:hypothetical protein